MYSGDIVLKIDVSSIIDKTLLQGVSQLVKPGLAVIMVVLLFTSVDVYISGALQFDVARNT